MAAPITTNPHGIVRIGNGRGFVVKGEWSRLVITAAHCLLKLPQPYIACSGGDRTYRSLLGPLGKRPKIWAECLRRSGRRSRRAGAPDDQELFEQSESRAA